MHGIRDVLLRPRVMTYVALYYSLLIAFGTAVMPADPGKGIFYVFYVTHFFVAQTLFGVGGFGRYVIVLLFVGIGLCLIWLKGWWRVLGVMAQIMAANLYGYYAAELMAAGQLG